jgi:hypothetical protein
MNDKVYTELLVTKAEKELQKVFKVYTKNSNQLDQLISCGLKNDVNYIIVDLDYFDHDKAEVGKLPTKIDEMMTKIKLDIVEIVSAVLKPLYKDVFKNGGIWFTGFGSDFDKSTRYEIKMDKHGYK